MTPKSVSEVLTKARVRLGEYRDATVHATKVKVWMKIKMCKWALCEVVASPSSKYIPEMYFLSDQGTLLLPSTVKQKESEFTLWPVLTAHDK